jgi:hypothetical protein
MFASRKIRIRLWGLCLDWLGQEQNLCCLGFRSTEFADAFGRVDFHRKGHGGPQNDSLRRGL